jgi:hypothetical protein
MFKFKSTKLRSNLTDIRNQWMGRRLTGRVSVPPEMQWWYYQEFGTATHLGSGNPGGTIDEGIHQQPVDASGHPEGYSIAPKLHNYLSWPLASGGNYFDFIIGDRGYRFFVPWHPGVEQKAFVRRVLIDIRIQAVDTLAFTMLKSGFDLESTRSALINSVMPAVKETIANSMAESLGSRGDGKLHGQDAATVFRTEASVLDLSTT